MAEPTPYVPDPEHSRPEGSSDALVAAVGKLSEAWERIERARGALFDFHQLIGGADAMLDEVVEGLRDHGYEKWATRIETDLVGRDVLQGRWTFQIVEEFEDDYYRTWRDVEQGVRADTMAGRRHVYEAELKQQRTARRGGD